MKCTIPKLSTTEFLECGYPLTMYEDIGMTLDMQNMIIKHRGAEIPIQSINHNTKEDKLYIEAGHIDITFTVVVNEFSKNNGNQ